MFTHTARRFIAAACNLPVMAMQRTVLMVRFYATVGLAAVITLTRVSNAYAVSAEDFHVPIKYDWANHFDGFFDYVGGNLLGLIIVSSAIVFPAIGIMIWVNSRNKHKVNHYLQMATTCVGVLLGALWIGVILEMIIVTPKEAGEA